MQAFLFTEKAKNELEALLNSIKSSSSYSLPSDKEKYPIADLRDSQVFGVLIAKNKSGENVMLYSFSGSINGHYIIPGYIPPSFDEEEFQKIVDINDEKIHELTTLIKSGEKELVQLRAKLSNETLEKLRKLYRFYTWDGKVIEGLDKSFPTGTGDCAGLKLINFALKKGWEIKGLAEGRLDGTFLSPCKERCDLILPLLFGQEIIYADESFAIINKKEGMLSVPGKGEEKLDSSSYRFHTLFPSSPKECYTHRLDMDTSGLLIMAFTKEAHRKISQEFEKREVKKTYEALLIGILEEDEGVVDAPLRLDVDNRPYQIIDYENGKKAITKWKKIGIEYKDGKSYTRVLFFPETGRTHQLRVHASSILKHPIKGDRLYGTKKDGERLCLHAKSISFIHPERGLPVKFTSNSDF